MKKYKEETVCFIAGVIGGAVGICVSLSIIAFIEFVFM